MSNDQHKLSVEIGVNAAEAIKGFNTTAEAAQRFDRTLGSLNSSLQTFRRGSAGGRSNIIGANDAKNLQRTLKVYQELNAAVNGYARAVRSLNSTDMARGSQNFNKSLQEMSRALRSVGNMSEQERKQKSETLRLYNELAKVQKTYTASLKDEAAAIREVANARKADAQAKAVPGAAAASGANAQANLNRSEAAQATAAARVVNAETQKQRAINDTALARQREARQAQQFAYRQQRDAERLAASERRRAQDTEQGLASTRYALYQVATAYGATAVAAGALPLAATRMAVTFEQEFANVEKVFQGFPSVMADLKEEMIDVSTEIPVAFEELRQIGTIGGQVGVAEQDIAQFSETISKFVATSESVQPDTAAAAFGRLSNMLQLTADDYENMASTISELGTSSAATEGEILAITESIATSANMAGFGADEVAGLSAAMASLRIRPEMARGAVMRIFNKINTAVADGGPLLDTWAQNAGLAADQAERMWREDPSQFFQRTAEGLSQIEDNVERQLFIRDQLDIRNARDYEMLARLSNGYEVYADSMSLAADAYARGDFLDTAFAPIAATTAAHLERLANAFRGFLASFGETNLGPINAAAEILITILNYLRDLPAPIKTAVTTMTALVAVFASIKAAMALGVAGMFAFRQMTKQTMLEGGLSVRAFGQQVVQTLGILVPGAARSSSVALAQAGGAAAASGGAARVASISWGALTKALLFSPAGIVMGLATVATTLWSIANASKSAEENSRSAAQRLIASAGGVQTIYEALQKDAEEFASGVQNQGDAIGEFTIKVRDNASSAEAAVSSVDAYADAQSEVVGGAQEATGAIEEQTLAIGKNTAELLKAAAVDMAGEFDQTGLAELLDRGFSINKFMELSLQGKEGAQEYVNSFAATMNAELNSGVFRDGALTGNLMPQEDYDRMVAGLEVLKQLTGQTGHFAYVQDELNNTMAIYRDLGIEADDATGSLEEGMGSAAEAAEALATELDGIVEGLFGVISAEADVEGALYNLGASIADNGLDFRTVTEEGRANLQALESTVSAFSDYLEAEVAAGNMTASDAANQFASYVNDLFAQLEQMGVDPSQFTQFRQYLADIFENSPVTPQVDIGPANRELAKLADYALGVANIVAGAFGGSTIGRAMRSVTSRAAGMVNNRLRSSSQAADAAKSRPRPDAQIPQANFGSLEMGKAQRAAENLAKAQEKNEKAAEKAGNAGKKAGDDTRTAAEKAEDYVRRLGEAFDKSFDRQFGIQEAEDAVELQLINMREAAEAARQKVADLRDEARKLRLEASSARQDERRANIFANVARQYGDTERYLEYTQQAKEARATVTEKERLARAADKEAKELDKNRNALTGNSKAAIENRAQVFRLQRAMADLTIAHARNGATQDQLRAITRNLENRFKTQLTQMGFNRREVGNLSTRFVHLRRDINNVPRNVRIKAEATNIGRTRDQIRGLTKPQTVPLRFNAPRQDLSVRGNLQASKILTNELQARQAKLNDYIRLDQMKQNRRFARGGVIPGKPPQTRSIDNLVGMSNDGMVSVQAGEGIVNHAALQHYGGAEWLNAINNMRIPQFTAPVAAGGGGGSGTAVQLVELLPHQIKQIAAAVSPHVTVGAAAIASATNAVNNNSARRNAN